VSVTITGLIPGGLLVPEGIIYPVVSVTITGLIPCGLLVPEGINYPVVSDSALTWFIRYIYY
jgi:hypothetical protein